MNASSVDTATIVAPSAPTTLPEITAHGIVSLVFFILSVIFVVRPISKTVLVPLPKLCLGRRSKHWWGRVKLRLTLTLGLFLAPLLAVLILLAVQSMPLSAVRDGIVGAGSLVPYSVVIIFFSLSYMSFSLDETGVFAAMSFWFVRKSGGSGHKLFFAVFLLSAIFTIFTSNDIVVMTLTPIVIYACQYMRADPTPFLLAEFMAANVWSAGLYISNATNIIIAESERITFTVFAKWCGLPTIVAGVSLYCLLVLWFRKRITSGAIDPDADTDASLLKNPRSAAVGSAILLATIVMLIVFSFVAVPTYIATLTCALAMLVKDIIVDIALLRLHRPADQLNSAATRVYVGGEIEDYYDARSDNEETEEQRRMRMSSRVFSFRMSEDDFPEDFDSADAPTSDDGFFPEFSVVPFSVLQPEWMRTLALKLPTVTAVMARQPWTLAPFLLCMFVLVENLTHHGWTHLIADSVVPLLVNIPAAAFFGALCTIVFTNIMSGQPMAILFARIMTSPFFVVGARQSVALTYAVTLTSNFAANFSLVGSLAGLLWLDILHRKNVQSIGFFSFTKLGVVVTLVVVPLSIGALCLEVGGFDLDPVEPETL
jgi:Na+/H+ antiporter NhaD/arsenite permease-like protein